MLDRFSGSIQSIFELAKNHIKIFLPYQWEIFEILDSNGFMWEVDSRLALDRHKILGIGDMVPEFIHFLWKHLENDSSVIDVGANAGYWTIPMSSHFANVVAFEPNSLVRGKLLRNLELNSISNVSVRAELCGREVSTTDFYEISLKDADGLMNNGLSGILNRGLKVNAVTRQMVPLDSLKIDPIAFLKIDVEGMEFEVLSGAGGLIKSCAPFVFWEASRTLDSNHGLTNVPDSLAFLGVRDYCHFMFLDDAIVEVSSDSSNLEPRRDFDVLSVPRNKAAFTRSLLKTFNAN
jgi:FkbM family methyltransferase